MNNFLILVVASCLYCHVVAEKYVNSRFCRPDYVAGGRYTYTGERNLVPVNGTVTYTCFETHEIVGQSTLTCLPSGWDRNPPVCNPVFGITCPRQPLDDSEFLNGIVEPFVTPEFTPGQKIWYACEAGYDIRRDQMQDITCLTDGSWSGPVPTCIPVDETCRPLTAPANGRLFNEQDEYRIGQVVNFECEDPYKIVGSSRLVCLPRSRWSGPEPTCGAPRCSRPRRPAKGFLSTTLDFYDVGTIVEFNCFDNYRLDSDVTTLECLSTGEWSTTEPDCIPVTCNPLSAPQSGTISSSRPQYNVNDMVTFTCNRYFTLDGAGRATCQSSGTWSASVPVCRARQCGRPVIESGSFVEDKPLYDVGDRVVFSCDPAYELSSEQPITCQRNGRWSDSFPECEAVRCGPPSIENGGFAEIKPSYRTNEDVTFFCDQGYELSGESTIICNGNDGWSSRFPTCNIRQCRRPQFPNGQLSPDQTAYDYRARVEFVCDNGYVLDGRRRLRCEDDTTWSDSIPTCNLIQCEKPVFENGRLLADKDSYDFQETVRFRCNNGFQIQGEDSLTCQANRRWSGAFPTCRQLSCKRPVIRAGSFTPSKDTYSAGDEVTFTCNTGFELDGSEVVRCLRTEEWDSSFPFCRRVRCARPTVPNGIPDPNAEFYRVGRTVTYSCQFGYLLRGAEQLTCQNDQSWSEEFPRCERIQCVRPSFPNGQLIRDLPNYDVNSDVTYRCNVGFTRRGADSSTCRGNGRFSPAPPVCERNRCSPPVSFDNGDYQERKRSYNPGESIIFSCVNGYFLLGTEQVVCGTEGSWADEFPICVPYTCGEVSITNGAFVEEKDTYSLGEVVRFTCNRGYTLQGSSSVTCAGEGEWDDLFPTCRENRCRREAVSNSRPSDNKDLFRPTEILTITCFDGYEINGASVLTCGFDGNWDSQFPSCGAVRCARPRLPNGRLDPSNAEYEVGILLQFICNVGYRREGVENARCRGDATWSEDIPTCEPVTCSRPTFEKGTFEEDKTSYSVGERVQFTCDEGYRRVGRRQLRCLNSGMWSADFPTCVPLQCDRPLFLFGTLRRDRRAYDRGERVSFTCDPGYEIDGAEELECGINKQWSDDFPVCRPVRCSQPEIENGDFGQKRDTYVVGNLVRFTCNENYQLVGANVIECERTRQWSDPFPRCEAITCVRPEIEFGSFEDDDLDSYTVGVTVEFECDGGYALNGEEISTCTNNRGTGVWSPRIPVCEQLACSRPDFDLSRGSFAPNTQVYPVDITVTFTCDDNYVLNGASDIICLDTARWSDSFPTCEPLTCSQPSIDNGEFRDVQDSYNPGQTVRFRCNDGYRLSRRNNVILCLSSGLWSADFPTCSRIQCRDPVFNTDIGSFTSTTTNYYVGTEVTFQCNNGYTLQGVETVTCEVNGRWNGQFPTCRANRCQRFILTEALSVSESRRSYPVSTIVSFSCSRGFQLQGESTLTCLPSGQWNADQPTCQKVTRCPHPDPEQANSRTRSFKQFYDVGETITYQCQLGYEVDGDDTTVTCRADGSFSAFRFTCIRPDVQCTRPYTPRNLEISPDTELYSVGQTVTYTCLNGLSVIGDSSSTCQRSGKFNRLTPSCDFSSGLSCRGRCQEPYSARVKCSCVFFCDLLEQGCCTDFGQFCDSQGF